MHCVAGYDPKRCPSMVVLPNHPKILISWQRICLPWGTPFLIISEYLGHTEFRPFLSKSSLFAVVISIEVQALSNTLAMEPTSSYICNFLERRTTNIFCFLWKKCPFDDSSNDADITNFLVSVSCLKDTFAFGFGCFVTGLQWIIQESSQ